MTARVAYGCYCLTGSLLRPLGGRDLLHRSDASLNPPDAPQITRQYMLQFHSHVLSKAPLGLSF